MDFIIDSGSSGTLITSELRDQLGVAASDGQARPACTQMTAQLRART
jgi:hypothetical protein